ncbi:MAG TPA: bacillithiol biosynthesis BshC, partial [Kofleriaceae bacterium]|nr:bacillithiol biosynthesis BshC [Kofleriaceae bacterium]
IASAMTARCAELERAGRTPQVYVRPGSPLSFFHPDGALGPRVRLDPAGSDGFAEVGSGAVHDRRALAAALRDDPRRFSTSALLRPIVQDTLLPTLAYVGGPAELAYFAQLGPVYAAFERAMPFVRPRARFRVTDGRTRKLLDRLGLTPRDAERPEAELLARGAAISDVRATLLAPFLAAHAELAHALDPQLARALGRTRASVERAIGKLASKVERHQLYADAQRVDAVRRVRAMLAPGGAPQERVLGLAGLAARVGDRALIARVLDHLNDHLHAHVHAHDASHGEFPAALALGPFAGALQELAA